jgi:hypothetical protein
MSAPTPTPRRRLLAVDSAPAQRRAGRVMVGVAIVGVVVALIGAVVGWQLVGQIDSTTRDTLDVSVESLDSLADTIELADEVLASTTQSLNAVASTLTSVSASFDSATAVLTEFSTFAETAGPTLADTTELVRELADVGTTVDEALGAVSNLPIGLDYDPEAGLGATLASLADTLEPLSAQFTSTADEIALLTDDIDTLRTDLQELNATVGQVTDDLDETDVLIEQYRVNIAEARGLAMATRDDVQGDASWMRLLIVLAAINFAIGQIVPLWFGRELLHRARGTPVTVAEVVTEVESVEERALHEDPAPARGRTD